MFEKQYADRLFDEYKMSFQRKFGTSFRYEFTDGDLKRIQTLINEIRELLTETQDLDDDHKRRLFKRLERLQAELHKTMSDLDHFWGLLVDGSIVLKKVGENAKPIVDRIREIISIVWPVQIRAEELPSNLPLELPTGQGEERLPSEVNIGRIDSAGRDSSGDESNKQIIERIPRPPAAPSKKRQVRQKRSHKEPHPVG